MQTEFLKERDFDDINILKLELGDYVNWYNNHRLHNLLDYLTPMKYKKKIKLVLPERMNKILIDTIRLKLIKIASKVIRSGRYIIFKLCSSCPYKKEFFETFENIRKITQLEWFRLEPWKIQNKK